MEDQPQGQEEERRYETLGVRLEEGLHAQLTFIAQLAVRVARDERQEIVQRHGEITPGAALCIAVECAAVISEPGLFDR